jgi:hypothetical protein
MLLFLKRLGATACRHDVRDRNRPGVRMPSGCHSAGYPLEDEAATEPPTPMGKDRTTNSHQDTVDPAALLAGVLAVAVIPLLEAGEWIWLNSAIAGVVCFILVAFYVASPRWKRLRFLEQLSVLAALWVVVLVCLAWPLQEATTDACREASASQRRECEDRRGDAGTAWGAKVAVPVVLAGGSIRWFIQRSLAI